jgi:fluoroacetyl-CoA thioesterase
MKPTLEPGFVHELSYRVPETKTVPHVYEESELFRAMPPVFATAFLVGLVEWACMQVLEPHLEPGEQSLGTHVDLSHRAPTPVGLLVKVSVRVEEIEGRRVRFAVRVADDAEVVSEGSHERFVIARERFLSGVTKKAERYRPPA